MRHVVLRRGGLAADRRFIRIGRIDVLWPANAGPSSARTSANVNRSGPIGAHQAPPWTPINARRRTRNTSQLRVRITSTRQTPSGVAISPRRPLTMVPASCSGLGWGTLSVARHPLRTTRSTSAAATRTTTTTSAAIRADSAGGVAFLRARHRRTQRYRCPCGEVMKPLSSSAE
jgi:hypothetical protein